MEKKPIILIAWGPCTDLQFYSQGMMLTKAYEWAVVGNGGIPMMPLDITCIDEYVELADGIIFPGAMNFKPLAGIPLEFTTQGSARHDEFEKKIYDAFKAAGKPIMGICEGHQKINCCEGGTLFLDLQETTGVAHMTTAHKIKTEPGSTIARLWGDDVYVNSYHNFHVNKLGDGLKITSVSPQGNVESLEHETLPIFGYQFHPERMRGDNVFPAEGADGDKLFSDFIRIAKDVRDGKGYTKA